MEGDAPHAAVGQAAVERPRRVQGVRVGARAAQGVALAVAGEGEHERRHERVDARVVDVPLVHAVLGDRAARCGAW